MISQCFMLTNIFFRFPMDLNSFTPQELKLEVGEKDVMTKGFTALWRVVGKDNMLGTSFQLQ